MLLLPNHPPTDRVPSESHLGEVAKLAALALWVRRFLHVFAVAVVVI